MVTGNFGETNINGVLVVANELNYVTFATAGSAVTVFEGVISENFKLSVSHRKWMYIGIAQRYVF